MALSTAIRIDTEDTAYISNGMAIDGGFPTFRVGQETEFSLLFQEDGPPFLFDYQFSVVFTGNPYENYKGIRDDSEYLTDSTVEYGTDYRQEPYYREFIHPQAPTNTSYLWLVEPDERIDNLKSWWVVVTEIVDETLVAGMWHRFDITGFVVAPGSEGDRAYIKDNYEV